MADYYSIITNRGKELEAEALASGRLIVLTHFVVGDSNGKQVKPDPAQIRLINETYRGDIAELVVSPEQSTQLMAKIVLPTGVGGFTVREVGLMTDAGELYAVANCPSIDKPVGGVSVNMQFRLAVSDTSNITLNVATGDGLFLRIDQNLKEIKARGAEAQKTSRESIGVLDGTTQQRGLVQLNSALNSTSETQAATPAAVKIVMDNANARLAKDRNGADIPNVALFLQNLGLSGFADKSANTKQIFADALSCKFGLEVFSPDGKRSAALYALDSGVSIANGTHSITIPDKAGTLVLTSDLANFADKSATEKQIFADAIQCKYGIAVADASGAVKTGLYSTNGKSYLASKAGQSVEIPDKNGVMALVDDVSDSAVGVGQTWKDVTSQRALNVVYTNSASKALTVLLTGSGYSSNGEKFLSASINGGPNIAFLGSGANNTSTIDSGLILIPAGATYKITSPTAFTINQWAELS